MSINTVKRINISLPVNTLDKIDTLTERGDRSRFIDQAVHFYVDAVGRKELRRALKEGALKNSSRDSTIATEWFPLDESVCQSNR